MRFSWLDNSPESWKGKRVKHLFYYSKDRVDDPSKYPILSLTMKGIVERDISKNEGQLPDTFNGYSLLKMGDIVFNPMDLISGWVDKSSFNGLISPSYRVLRPRENNLDVGYFNYFFQIHYKERIFFPFGEGVHYQYRWGLGSETLMNFPVLFPSIFVQQQIVSYLDLKTQLIDNLIQQKIKKIELLKEKRTSLINHVITKGLYPNVEMKDSGEGWFSSYPSSWGCVNFRVMCNLQQGLQIPFDKRYFEKTEDSYEYITTQSIHKPDQPRQFIKSPKKSVICFEEDILYGRTGNTGEVVTNIHGVFHNNFFKIDYNREKIYKDFLVWYLNNLRFREHILLLSGTTTIPDLNHGSFYSTRMLLPSIMEQKQIVKYLDDHTKEIDELVELEQNKIKLLKEYRRSLISEVVTGKIDVRDK